MRVGKNPSKRRQTLGWSGSLPRTSTNPECVVIALFNPPCDWAVRTDRRTTGAPTAEAVTETVGLRGPGDPPAGAPGRPQGPYHFPSMVTLTCGDFMALRLMEN